MYAIVDIETTGSRPTEDKITEIAIVLHDGQKVVDSFTSLINPGRSIPYEITQLTGITNEMVREAPRFHEVARRIVEFTEGKVFVAHNVRFDYSFLKSEFHSLGYNYQRKTLCTVRLSRKLLPGFPSYSLGKLCSSLKIPLTNRHRAYGDAEATSKLFDKILKLEKPHELIDLIDDEIKAQTLPPQIRAEQVMALPEETGVYYFHDAHGHVIYVGKSKNIKKRIVSHFAMDYKSRKSIEFKNSITDISYEVTGSELVALLLESDEIKRIKPKYNSAQKRTGGLYGIYQELDKNGYLHLYFDRIRVGDEPLVVLQNYQRAQGFLYRQVEKFNLCLKMCDLHKIKGPCFDFQLRRCKGACIGHESAEEYNARVQEAVNSFSFSKENFVIVGRGRSRGEKSVVCIEGGKYKGFGYFEEMDEQPSLAQIRGYIKPYAHNRDIQKIICGYLKANVSDHLIKYTLNEKNTEMSQ
ncbi:exonuclease domain-containing protein [Rhodocytophaga aerolata]|uniref:Exonuclease domain-containing protein n=1 Tax=Rhodocytophaga aerolata TaxID=455078 RepID=A0ABT8R509_9BACT|nr:exonuclease domain-containing protein [Rhodocytophaga aerolata]MDO1445735.1 exonuclease domain-containing protein [Rhodocytophaga aerolata]